MIDIAVLLRHTCGTRRRCPRATASFRPLASSSRSSFCRWLESSGSVRRDFLSGPRTRDTQMGGDSLTS